MADIIYPNAPISEAIIDIRVRPTVEPDLDLLAKVQTGEGNKYPLSRKPLMFEFQVSDVPTDPKVKASSAQIGVSFASADGRDVFVARRDGFSLHRLRPYTHWAVFRGEAQRLWKKYRDLVQPQAIDMLLVRNVNHLPIAQGQSIESVLRLYPAIPTELPQEFGNLALTLDLPSPAGRGRLLINEGLVPAIPDTSKMALLLDITAYIQSEPQSSLTEEAIWSTLDQMRAAKNAAFEACITDEVRKSIS